MGGSYRSTAAVSQQHGQAVGHHDGAHGPALRSHAGVGLQAIGAAGIERNNVGAVYLAQENRAGSRRLLA
jgi:hypothetical protein